MMGMVIAGDSTEFVDLYYKVVTRLEKSGHVFLVRAEDKASAVKYVLESYPQYYGGDVSVAGLVGFTNKEGIVFDNAITY